MIIEELKKCENLKEFGFTKLEDWVDITGKKYSVFDYKGKLKIKQRRSVRDTHFPIFYCLEFKLEELGIPLNFVVTDSKYKKDIDEFKWGLDTNIAKRPLTMDKLLEYCETIYEFYTRIQNDWEAFKITPEDITGVINTLNHELERAKTNLEKAKKFDTSKLKGVSYGYEEDQFNRAIKQIEEGSLVDSEVIKQLESNQFDKADIWLRLKHEFSKSSVAYSSSVLETYMEQYK